MTLKKGCTGEPVKELQRRLNVEVKANLNIDGVYGTKTTTAVIQFQEKQGLKIDGIAGPCTLTALGMVDTNYVFNNTEDIKQFSKPWGNEIYGPTKDYSTFKSGGCGCISAVICVRYYGLAGDETQYETVKRVANVCINKKYRVKGKGTTAGVFNDKDLGLKRTACSSANTAEQAIREGKLVVVCVRKGWSSYTGTGHWLVITGIDGDTFLVRDVGSSASARQKVPTSDWKYVKNAYIVTRA